MDDDGVHGLMVAAGMVGALIGVMLGITVAEYRSSKDMAAMRAEAIEAGAARWTVNEKTGEQKFD